jgi:histidine ammonia-lyase
MPGRRGAAQKLGMEPLQLGPKEGLALINGTQASTAIALDALFAGERVFAAAHRRRRAVGRCAQGFAPSRSTRAFSSCAASPARSASPPRLRGLLDGSEILASHGRCGKVQDPYSFRCQPQVMGAALDLLAMPRAR